MDPVSLIVTALVAGASAALKDTAGDAIRSGYLGLKSLLKRKLDRDPLDPVLVDQHEKDPDLFAEALRARLIQIEAGDDEEIVGAAEAVLRIADPEGTRTGKYRVHVSGGQGAVIGEHNTVTQNYHNAP
ncbi:hypothetical protein O7626_05040 [Micromonospora sp. WMMD1102]|uniref:hypothetical protein n=1 Tax=Micromonospora sp. WMMD1102 TaxID=3016105 RepID=UPI0024152702|nr:hypothetical protein [Micromonospora sp. WMMD1102]MDG4785302.1 hypothetical protein [Micromonospora sp. WMMD1102]